MIRPVLAVVLNTYREVVRNKILYAILFYTVLLVLTGHFFADVSLNQERRILFDIGVGLLSLFSVVLCIFAGTSVIYKEIEKKTIFLIVPRAISRGQFLLGKWGGLFAAMTVVVTAMFLILLLQVMFLKIPLDVALLKGVLLVYFEVALLIAVALFFSSFSSPAITAMLTVGFFAIGRLLPDLKQILFTKYQADGFRTVSEELLNVFPHFYLYVPNGHDFNGHTISLTTDYVTWAYVGWAFLYTVLMCSLILIVAAGVFRRRDLA